MTATYAGKTLELPLTFCVDSGGEVLFPALA